MSLEALDEAPAVRAPGRNATAWLLVNPVEYHGPHLSLHNDHLCSLGLARLLAARLDGPQVYAGEIGLGVDPACGPGSRHTPYRQVRSAVIEACRALSELGVARVVLMTFHGSPLHNHALHAGARWLARRGIPAAAPFALLLEDLVELDDEPIAAAFETIEDPEDRAAMRRELPLDFHAGFFETSVALHLAPESVDPVHLELPDCPAWPTSRPLALLARLFPGRVGAELATIARVAGWTALRPYPGYTGRPRLASPAAGAVFTRTMVEAFAAEIERAFEAGAHRPLMGWLRWLTLGGRLGPPRVPLTAVSPAPRG